MTYLREKKKPSKSNCKWAPSVRFEISVNGVLTDPCVFRWPWSSFPPTVRCCYYSRWTSNPESAHTERIKRCCTGRQQPATLNEPSRLMIMSNRDVGIKNKTLSHTRPDDWLRIDAGYLNRLIEMLSVMVWYDGLSVCVAINRFLYTQRVPPSDTHDYSETVLICQGPLIDLLNDARARRQSVTRAQEMRDVRVRCCVGVDKRRHAGPHKAIDTRANTRWWWYLPAVISTLCARCWCEYVICVRRVSRALRLGARGIDVCSV